MALSMFFFFILCFVIDLIFYFFNDYGLKSYHFKVRYFDYLIVGTINCMLS